jgi:hypothetical protein
MLCEGVLGIASLNNVEVDLDGLFSAGDLCVRRLLTYLLDKQIDQGEIILLASAARSDRRRGRGAAAGPFRVRRDRCEVETCRRRSSAVTIAAIATAYLGSKRPRSRSVVRDGYLDVFVRVDAGHFRPDDEVSVIFELLDFQCCVSQRLPRLGPVAESLTEPRGPFKILPGLLHQCHVIFLPRPRRPSSHLPFTRVAVAVRRADRHHRGERAQDSGRSPLPSSR